MNILRILDELAADPSRLVKEAIIRREKDNDLLKLVFKAAYDPFVNYWQVKIPAYTPSKNPGESLQSVILVHLDHLAKRGLTGGAAVTYLANALADLQPDDAEVVKRIVGRDLRCGCSDSTANKIWPGLTPTFDVMLAHKDCSGIKYPAYCQTKMDGMRGHMTFDGVHATVFTRNGKVIELRGALDASAKAMMKAGETFDGEIVFYRNGKALPRKESNGLGNKGVKNTITVQEAAGARFIAWDIVDFAGTKPYTERFEQLGIRMELAGAKNTAIYQVASQIVGSYDEALALYEVTLASGEEGCILKNMKAVWQPKRVKDLGKMKAEEEADLIVVGWYYGDKGKKYENALGGLICTTSDGLIEVNVGTFKGSEEIRFLPLDEWIGKIVTVKYNMRIKAAGDKKESLFLPIYVETRLDKNIANKASELK
jgi:hypothetical protein